MVYSNDIITLFFGHEYSEAGPVLSILMWTLTFFFINGLCTNLLNASHKEKYVTLTFMIAAIFNTILNLFIIPQYSYIGASITTILSDILISILFFYSIYKLNLLPKKKLCLDLFKIIFASLTLYGSLIVLNLNMWIALIVGIIIYFAAIILIKTFDDEDKFIIKEILGIN